MSRQTEKLHIRKITIPSGQSSTIGGDPLDLRLIKPVSLIIPSAWTTADLVFSGSPNTESGNYGYLSTPNGIILLPADAGLLFVLPSAWFVGVNFLHLVSGNPLGSLVNQTADRVLRVICKDRATADVVVTDLSKSG